MNKFLDKIWKFYTVIGMVVSELSFGALLMLQLFVMVAIWLMLSGASQLLTSIPNWALAVAGGGAACLMAASILLKTPRLFVVPVFVIFTLAVQVGSAEFLMGGSASDPSTKPFNFPSFGELVSFYSWMVVAGLTIGGLVSMITVSQQYGKQRERKAKRGY